MKYLNLFHHTVKQPYNHTAILLRTFLLPIILYVNFSFAQGNNPIADPDAIVIKDDVRFTVLTPQLIRMEWSSDKKFEDHASFVFINRNLPVPEFETREENDAEDRSWFVIQTKKMTLRYKTSSGVFNKDNLEISFQVNNTTSVWRPGIENTGNLKGTIRTLDGVNGSTKLEDGILSRDGWTLVDDSERPLFSAEGGSASGGDNSEGNWVMPRQEGDSSDWKPYQDWYFFGYGHEYKKQLYDFTLVAGKIPLPPRFAFGTWWSRYWNYTDEELKNLVNQFHTFDVPLDVLVVDMDWHYTQADKLEWGNLDQAGLTYGWTGYTWNKNYFPDPQGFLKWTEEQKLKVTLNLHPASGIQPHEQQYKAMAEAMGVDPTTEKYIPFDITNKKFARNYFDIVIHPLEKDGVDFWWLDWQQWHTTSIPGVTPTWWINYVFFTDMERQGKRPMLFHRWGGLGNHRYQIGFSGDTHSTWESLAFQPYFTSTASNVGFGYWSHDIGGHMPGPVTPELYTRWVQFGAFSPALRTHSSKNPLAERRIWGYPYDYFKVMKEIFLLRYSLIPYIYTASREAYDTGISLCRPMYYDYPEKDEAYNFTGQYMYGNDLLVAPVASPVDSTNLLAEKEIWLPEGKWFEWFTGNMLKGPAVVKRNFSIDQIPVFVKAGSIIPMQLPDNGTNSFVNPLVLTVFPGDSGSTSVYEDAGNSLDYKNDKFSKTRITQHIKVGKQLIEIYPAEGKYDGMPEKRSYKIILPSVLTPQKILCNGAELKYEYDGDKLTVSATTQEFKTSEKVEIEIQHSTQNEFELVNGFVEELSRIKKVKDLIHSKPGMWNVETIISASQTGRRISLNPENTIEELKAFKESLGEIKIKLETLDLPEETRTLSLNHIEDILKK